MEYIITGPGTGEVSVCVCGRDRVVKRVRRGGSSSADGFLITCLAIWTVVTEMLNPIHHGNCALSNCFSACTHLAFPGHVWTSLYISPPVLHKSVKMLMRT